MAGVTRIVAGVAGGRTLRVPGSGTRPTSDRVREALFSRLDHMGVVEGARVLDMYAGSGALGLEAASRGAGEVVLVDSTSGAARVCRQNATTLGLPAQVVQRKALTYLTERVGEPFDLVLCDPPYAIDAADLTAVLTALVPHLAPDAVVVVERGVHTSAPEWPTGLEPVDDRRYGETVLWFAHACTGGPTVAG